MLDLKFPSLYNHVFLYADGRGQYKLKGCGSHAAGKQWAWQRVNKMALWRLASNRGLARLTIAARQFRQTFTTQPAIDYSKPEPPNGFLFNEKVYQK